MPARYNYNAALQLIQKAFAANKHITYKEMEEALGLEFHIGDKETRTAECCIYRLRKLSREKYGLTFKSAAKTHDNNPEYYYYIVSKLKDGFTKKETGTNTTTAETKITPAPKTEIKTEAYEALSKNNQKLYAELEQLKDMYGCLETNYMELCKREQEYLKVIESLYKLLTM